MVGIIRRSGMVTRRSNMDPANQLYAWRNFMVEKRNWMRIILTVLVMVSQKGLSKPYRKDRRLHRARIQVWWYLAYQSNDTNRNHHSYTSNRTCGKKNSGRRCYHYYTTWCAWHPRLPKRQEKRWLPNSKSTWESPEIILAGLATMHIRANACRNQSSSWLSGDRTIPERHRIVVSHQAQMFQYQRWKTCSSESSYETKAAFYHLKQGKETDQAYQVRFMNTGQVIEQCGASDVGEDPLTRIMVCKELKKHNVNTRNATEMAEITSMVRDYTLRGGPNPRSWSCTLFRHYQGT